MGEVTLRDSAQRVYDLLCASGKEPPPLNDYGLMSVLSFHAGPDARTAVDGERAARVTALGAALNDLRAALAETDTSVGAEPLREPLRARVENIIAAAMLDDEAEVDQMIGALEVALDATEAQPSVGAEPEALDVERLARALHVVHGSPRKPWAVCTNKDAHREAAGDVAAAYRALPADGEREHPE